MNESTIPESGPSRPVATPTAPPPDSRPNEVTRAIIFLVIQGGFLLMSPLAGGFHRAAWSMLDSALLVMSIGITALVFVLDSPRHRTFAFKTAIVLYILAIIDMSINILVSGIVGWKSLAELVQSTTM